MAILNELKAKLGLDTAQFSNALKGAGNDTGRLAQRIQSQLSPGAAAMRGLSRATNGLGGDLHRAAGRSLTFGSNFVKGLAVGAVTAVLAELSGGVRQVVGDIADMADAAERVDINVEDFQGLQHGFKLAGVDASQTAGALEKFSVNIGEAIEGGGKLGKILAANGVSLRNTDGSIRSTSDLLREFADIVKDAPSQAERMALITDAFGRGGKGLILAMSEGSVGIDQMIARAKEGGYVLDESVVKKAQELDDKFDNLTTRIGVAFKTLVVGAADGAASLLSVKSELERVFGSVDKAGGIFGKDASDKLLDPKVVEENKQGIEETRAAYEQLMDTANKTADAISAEVPYMLELGATDAASALADMSDQLQQAAIDLDKGTINGVEFERILLDVSNQASTTLSEIQSINGVDLSDSISVVDALRGALNVLAERARLAAMAVASAVLSKTGPSFETGGRGGNPAPIVVQTPDNSTARSKQRPMDLGDTSSTRSSGGGSKGGGRKLSDEQREAARLFEQTRTDAEKYAEELKDLDRLLKSGAISQDTYNRGLDAAKEKYGQAGDASKFFKKTAEDLQEAFLDAAIDGVNSFDQIERAIKRAALQALIFGKGPLAGLFSGGSTAGDWLSGIASALGFAKGGVFSGGKVQAFASGGVVASPTYFGMSGRVGLMGEAGPEAILPLSRGAGGKLGVAMQGGGGMAVSIGFDPSIGGLTAMITDEAGRVVAQAAPAIVSQSAQAVSRAMAKSKSFGGY